MVTSPKMILHVDYWDKKQGSKARVSFQISAFEDYKDIVKGLRSKRLKIVQISIQVTYQTGD